MKTKIIIYIVISIFLASVTSVFAANKGGGNTLVLNLVGYTEMYLREVPDIDGQAMCFDLMLLNAENGHVVGTATDCLSSVDNDGDGLKLVGTTYFYLPQGTLVTRGLTTVHPVDQPTGTIHVDPVTHITGAASSSIEGSILDGDGRFKGATGTVRLSGMVDMTNFNPEGGNVLGFDCLFVITLD